MEKLVLKAFLGGTVGGGGAAGGRGDDGEKLDLGEGGAWDVEALGVGAGIGRGEEEAGIVDQGIEQGAVAGRQALQQVSGAERQAEPEALSAGPGEEGAAHKALGVLGVGEVEFPDVADGFDVAEWQRKDAAGEVEQVEGLRRGRSWRAKGSRGGYPRRSA